MAKELPYFKFEPNQWENGNIQICSRNDKGLFIDICSVYWSRVGDLPLQLVINKLCGGNAIALDSLISAEIIRVENSKVIIDFLDEQLQEFDNLSSMNRENAKKRWSKQQEIKDLIPPHSDRNATASDPQCENDAIRGEKKREDNKKVKKKSPAYYSIFIEAFNKVRDTKFRDTDQKFRRNLDNLLKSGYMANDALTAYKNAIKDQYHIETGFKHLTPEFITRIDKLEKFLNAGKGTVKQVQAVGLADGGIVQ